MLLCYILPPFPLSLITPSLPPPSSPPLFPSPPPLSSSLPSLPFLAFSSQLLDIFNATDLIASATASIGNLSIDGSTLIPSDLVDSLRNSLPNVTELDFSTSLLATVNDSLTDADMDLDRVSAELANFTSNPGLAVAVSGANVFNYVYGNGPCSTVYVAPTNFSSVHVCMHTLPSGCCTVRILWLCV